MLLRETLAQARDRLLDGLALVTARLPFVAVGRQICERLQANGATTPERALRFHPRNAIEEHAFLQLLRSRVIREPTPGRYYVVVAELQRRGEADPS